MTGKSKATDGALDEVVKRLHWIVDARDDENADLDSICTYAEQALAYLAALAPHTGEPVAWRWHANETAKRLSLFANSYGISIPDDAREVMREAAAILAAPPQVEPAEGETAELIERLKDHYRTDVGMASETGDDIAQAVGALTNQSAELLSLRRKVEETEAERDAAIDDCAAIARRHLAGYDEGDDGFGVETAILALKRRKP